MNLSKIILGCEQIGGKDHGYINHTQLTKVFKDSLNYGINSFDVAGIYNLGKSEKNLNKIFSNNIKNLNIITKGGLDFFYEKGNRRAKVVKNFDFNFLKESIEQSCLRLGINKIPLFLIHYPPENKKKILNVCDSLEKFKSMGLIENYGFSNIDYKLFNYAYKKFQIYAIENSLNLLNFNQQIETFKKINPKVKKIAHSVLAQGILTGKYNHKSIFPKNDRRHRMEFFSKKKLLSNYRKITELKKIAENFRVSTTVLAISFLINIKLVDSIIIGVKNNKQFTENISALNFNITNEIEKKISEIYNLKKI